METKIKEPEVRESIFKMMTSIPKFPKCFTVNRAYIGLTEKCNDMIWIMIV